MSRYNKHSFLLLASLLLLAVFQQEVAAQVPLGAPLVALPRSSNCIGTVNISLVAPVAGSVFSFSALAQYSADLPNQRYAFSLGTLGGKQYVFANGTYEVLFDPITQTSNCFYYPAYTFAFESLAKSSATKIDRFDALTPFTDHYFGLVRDAAACDTYIALNLYVNTLTNHTRALDFQQPTLRPRNADGSCSPKQTDTLGTVTFTGCGNSPAAPAFFRLPAQCFAPTVLPFCQVFCV